MRAKITERGQVPVPAQLRLVTLPIETVTPDPLGALGFAVQHGLEEGSADAYLRALRAGEENTEEAD